MKIGNRRIDSSSSVFIVAELSANHGRDFNTALKTIDAMKEAGADAVKIQTYTPDTITIDCDNSCFVLKQGTIWDGKTFYQLYKESYTPWEWQPKLQEHAENLGLIFFSSPFDKSAVDFLDKLNVPAYKVASFEITDIPLIEYIAEKGKPIIISTGIANMDDIRDAVDACRRKGNEQISLLKCTSAYPCPITDLNLRTIPDLEKRFGVIAGLSDHSMNNYVPIAAVSLGAKIIEKHIILDRSFGGPDAPFSLEPAEFKEMVRAIREIEISLGSISYSLTEKMKQGRELSRSLFVIKDMRKGDLISEENVKSIRPSYGLHPRFLNSILGRRVTEDVKKGTPLCWELIEEEKS